MSEMARIDRSALLALPGHAQGAQRGWALREWLDANARTRGDHPAIEGIGRAPLSHKALAAFVRTLGDDLLQAGVGRGDVVIVSLPDGPEALTAILAVASVAAVFPVPVDEPLPSLESLAAALPVRAALFDAARPGIAGELAVRAKLLAIPARIDARDAAGVFAWPPLPRATQAAQPARVDDASIVVKTAGTTGAPKVIAWSQASLARSTDAAAQWMALGPADRSLCIMPLAHLHSIIRSTVPILRRGGSVTCCPGFDATRILAWIAQHRPTFMTAVPGIYRKMLERVGETRWTAQGCTLSLLVTGSDAVDEKTLVQLASTFGVRVQEFYGQSEVTPFFAVSRPGRRARLGGAIGHAVPPWVLCCFDDEGRALPRGCEGAIGARGGLLNPVISHPGDPRCAGDWYLTGDRGWIDSDGALHVSGRVDDRINRGGRKIAPEAVEAVLAAHASVRDALVFPIDDAAAGTRVGALVVLDGQGVFDERELRAFVAQRLAAYMVPDRIVAVDALPLSATGKKSRGGLAKQFLAVARVPEASRHDARDSIESVLKAIAAEVTARTDADLDADYESAGIDSFTSLSMMLRIEERFGLAITPADFLRCGNLAGLARWLRDRGSNVEPASMSAPQDPLRIVTLQQGDGTMPLFIPHGIDGLCAYFHAPAARGDPRLTVLGIQWSHETLPARAPTLEAHAAECVAAIRAVQPEGPYHLAGYSFAAHLALEIARQLFEAGGHVAFLGILDDEADLGERHFGVIGQELTGTRAGAHCLRMLRGHVCRSYPGDAWLFQARVRPLGHLADPLQGWGDVVCGTLHRFDVPGDHHSMLHNEVVREWIGSFAGALAAARREGRHEQADARSMTRRIAAAHDRDARAAVRAMRDAREAAKAGRLDAELVSWREAVRAEPDALPHWAYRQFGEALAQAGDNDAALEAFLDASRREGVPICGLTRVARHLFAMGRDEQAGAILQQARTLGSDEPHAHIALAEVESLIGDEAAAEAHLRRAWEIEPNGEAWIRLALLLARRGRGGEVIATANEVRARWAGDERLGALVDQLEGLVAPDVHLVADGERIEPASADSKCWRFKLPRAARHVVIASRSCVPARTHNGARDARCLGVPVKRIVLRSTHAEMDVRHDHPLLGEGFHPCEGGQRWTNGAGRIPDALLAAMSDVDSVEVHLSSLSLQYSAFGR